MREPRAYLARIAHGLLVDHRRRQALERTWLETLAAMPETAEPSREEHQLIADALTRIDALLDGLKPRGREVFLLSRLEGKSYPRIGEQLTVSLSAVEKDVVHVLRRCYQVLIGVFLASRCARVKTDLEVAVIESRRFILDPIHRMPELNT